MQRPSLLSREEPYQALCRHFNVSLSTYTGTTIPSTFDMTVTRDAHMPTHVLAALPPDTSTSPSPSIRPLMFPIDATLYNNGFRVELNTPIVPPSTAPAPRNNGNNNNNTLTVSLPVIPISIPDLSSFPLLLLFGMGLETQPNLLAWRLLPSQVIEEFPNAAAMAQILARAKQEQFDRIFRFNQGLWRNILALGMKDTKVVELVQTAWNVTAEARRIRQRPSSSRR